MGTPTLLSSWRCALAVLGIIALDACSAATSNAVVASVPSLATPAASVGGKLTVWDGVYVTDQATRGQELYARQCASCHREDLHGEDCAPPLIGDAFWARWNDALLGTMYERIRTTMPEDAPGWLSPQAYADIVGFLLKANDLPAGPRALPADQGQLNQIVIIQAKTAQP